jgi:hypothetical protein
MRTLARQATMSFAPGELWGLGAEAEFRLRAARPTPAEPRGPT